MGAGPERTNNEPGNGLDLIILYWNYSWRVGSDMRNAKVDGRRRTILTFFFADVMRRIETRLIPSGLTGPALVKHGESLLILIL